MLIAALVSFIASYFSHRAAKKAATPQVAS